MRGAIYMRCLGRQISDYDKTCVGHLVHFVSRQQRIIVRATFTAELQAGCDTIDAGFHLVQTMHEYTTGCSTATESMKLRMNGGYIVPMILYIDAMSVYAAITATFVKTPAEQGVLIHLQHIRELLDENVLEALAWSDTRDMYADGTTKGSIDRAPLHSVMDGQVVVTQPMKIWRPKHLLNS